MKKIILLISILLSTIDIHAIPALNGAKKFIKLTDGTEVLAELKGDEFMSYWETADGKQYVRNGQADTYIPADIKTMYANAQMRRSLANSSRMTRAASVMSRTSIGGDHTTYAGKKKGLIILVEFSDKSFKSGHDNAFYQNVANQVGYTSILGFKGSVKDYFLSQSNGTFELDFDIVGPVKLSHNYAYYGAHDDANNDVKPGAMVAQACLLADSQVDFSKYDWNNDGWVDQVYILYAGPGEASGGDENTIWPHESHLDYSDYGKTLSLDGVGINTYACGCELTYSYVYNRITGSYQTIERTDGIGTICHEFSHCLGLPDFYDTRNNTNYGMGTWDIMDEGSYNGNSFCPPNYTGYEKIYCGWIDAIELNKATTVKNMKSSADYGKPFIVYNAANANEFYLLENRQQSGWDASLYGKGLLITHVDFDKTTWEYNVINSIVSYSNLVNDHQRCTIFHADNESGQRTTSSIAGDPYPYIGTDGTVNKELTNTSSPADSVYNKNADGTFLMNKPITNITQNADGTVSFDFMGGSTTNIITGIKTINQSAEALQGRIYSIDGRYLGNDLDNLEKGIYIINGKKIAK